MAENWGAAKDSAALLAVMIDQAALDGGRLDIEHPLSLQKHP